MAGLYAAVRADHDPERAHAAWRSGRDTLFRAHPQSPLPPGDPLRKTGLPYWDYDRAMRFELPLVPVPAPQQRQVPTAAGETTTLRLIGQVTFPAPLDATVDVWWLRQYGGGLFLPLRDGTAGDTSYGGGRYALDTAKGADLGGTASTLVIGTSSNIVLPVQRPMAVPSGPGRKHHRRTGAGRRAAQPRPPRLGARPR